MFSIIHRQTSAVDRCAPKCNNRPVLKKKKDLAQMSICYIAITVYLTGQEQDKLRAKLLNDLAKSSVICCCLKKYSLG